MNSRLVLPLGLCLLALAACGQKNAGSQAPGGSAPITESEAPPPTPAQAKAMVASLPAPWNTGDPELGKATFARCRACHTTTQGGPDTVGPNLWGLFGRDAGAKPGYAYSDALKNAGYKWDAEHLDKWLTDPRAYRPGTKMMFVGLRDAKDRADVIAYLKTATEAPPK